MDFPNPECWYKNSYKRGKTRKYTCKVHLPPCVWTHTTFSICFTLFIDNFGVKYIGKEYAQHLMAVLEKHYAISHDCERKRYLGIGLDWDHDCRYHATFEIGM